MDTTRADRFTLHHAEPRDSLGDEGQPEEHTEPMIHPDLLLPSRPMSPRLPVFLTAVVACWTLATIGELRDTTMRLELSLLAGVLAALVASVGSWRRASSEGRMITAAVSVTLVCSVIGVVLFQGERVGADPWSSSIDWARTVVMGLGLGLVRALGMAPVAIVLYRIISTVGRARSGSLCDGADRRAVWSLTAALALGFCGLFLVWNWNWVRVACARDLIGEASAPICATRYASVESQLPPEFVVPAVIALVVLLGVLLLDVIALVRCRLAAARSEGLVEWRDAGGVIEQGGRRALDLGIGEARWVTVTHEGDPYRGERRARVALVGEPVIAQGLLRFAALRSTLLAGVGAAIVVMTCLRA